MSEYTGVIDKYIRKWYGHESGDSRLPSLGNPNAYKFMNAHKNYQVSRSDEGAWKRGKEFNKGDVIFTFTTHFHDGDWEDITSVKLHGILYVMEDEYGYRNWERRWNINSGWNTTSTSWGLNLEEPFIIVIPFKNMIKSFDFLNWNTNPFQRK